MRVYIDFCFNNDFSFFFIIKDEVSWIEWKKALNDALIESQQTYTVTEKASKIYGAQEVKRIVVQE